MRPLRIGRARRTSFNAERAESAEVFPEGFSACSARSAFRLRVKLRRTAKSALARRVAQRPDLAEAVNSFLRAPRARRVNRLCGVPYPLRSRQAQPEARP